MSAAQPLGTAGRSLDGGQATGGAGTRERDPHIPGATPPRRPRVGRPAAFDLDLPNTPPTHNQSRKAADPDHPPGKARRKLRGQGAHTNSPVGGGTAREEFQAPGPWEMSYPPPAKRAGPPPAKAAAPRPSVFGASNSQPAIF